MLRIRIQSYLSILWPGRVSFKVTKTTKCYLPGLTNLWSLLVFEFLMSSYMTMIWYFEFLKPCIIRVYVYLQPNTYICSVLMHTFEKQYNSCMLNLIRVHEMLWGFIRLTILMRTSVVRWNGSRNPKACNNQNVYRIDDSFDPNN